MGWATGIERLVLLLEGLAEAKMGKVRVDQPPEVIGITCHLTKEELPFHSSQATTFCLQLQRDLKVMFPQAQI